MPTLPTFRKVPHPWGKLSASQARQVRAVAATLVESLDHVTDWRLQKACFLAEVWSIEERLDRLSPADFASWHHGPWSLHVREAEEFLEGDGVLSREARPAKRRPEADFLQLARKTGLPQLPARDKEFLEEAASQVRYLEGPALTAVAKATSPYLGTRPGQQIDLDGYLSALLRKHARLQESSTVAAMVAEARSA